LREPIHLGNRILFILLQQRGERRRRPSQNDFEFETPLQYEAPAWMILMAMGRD
jgi:hypothetical protein